MNVVITGSTKGFGLALANEFLNHGDNVIINSRDIKNINIAYDKLNKHKNLYAFVGNVRYPDSIIEYSKETLGSIDIWINNAGTCTYKRQNLCKFSDSELEEIVNTNLLGTMLCSKNLLNIMNQQETGGTIVNIEGAGSNMLPTPGYSIYGSTKAGITQFTNTLSQENNNPKVDIITLSPGMMMTDLIMSDADDNMKQMFNILCETPESVAKEVVPILRTKYKHNIRYLNVFKIFQMILSNPFRKRFF